MQVVLFFPVVAVILASIILMKRTRPLNLWEKIAVAIATFVSILVWLTFLLGTKYELPLTWRIFVSIGGASAIQIVILAHYRIIHLPRPKAEKTTRKIIHEKFVGQIVGKKQAYQRGEPIQFRSRFSGSLTNGFFANIISAPRIPVGIDVTRCRTFSTTTPNISEDGRFARTWPLRL
jgi:hypothetical protein